MEATTGTRQTGLGRRLPSTQARRQRDSEPQPAGAPMSATGHLSPNGGEPFGIVWTLCVEEYFYLLLPIAFWVLRPRGTAVLLAVIVALTCLPQLEVLPGTVDFGTWFLIPVNLLTGAVLAA